MLNKNSDQQFDINNISSILINDEESVKWTLEKINELTNRFNEGVISDSKYKKMKQSHLDMLNFFIKSSIKKNLTDENIDIVEDIDQSIGFFEFCNIVSSAYKEIQNQVVSKKVQALSWDQVIAKDLRSKEFLLEPIIKEKDLIMVYAERGVGKTHLSTGIAWAISTGTSFLSWEANRSVNTLFIDGEMPLVSIRDRLMNLSNGLSNSQFKIVSHDTLLADQIMPDLSTLEGQESLEDLVDWADFIVLDNLATLCRSGRENTTEAWRITQDWLLSLRANGKTILLVDHAGKNGTNRGSSAKQDVLDTVLCLKHPSDYEYEQGARFIVKVEKNRNGEKIEDIEVHLVNGHWNISTAKQSRNERIIEMYKSDMTQRDIAQEMDCSLGLVSKVIKAYKQNKK
ncbi:AAA family ATPase [Francisella uliginis]|uniref:AAA family ATPase n=1 Tax=Francisella uliginis TaxID=573570 RepID=UPI000A022FCE|nr:AAA family ATPase [Francisella uliginis]